MLSRQGEQAAVFLSNTRNTILIDTAIQCNEQQKQQKLDNVEFSCDSYMEWKWKNLPNPGEKDTSPELTSELNN